MADRSDKCVAVMGGSRWIGRAIARGFAEGGASMAICARGQEALDRTSGELERLGITAFATNLDLRKPAPVAAFVADAASALGGLDVLVNSASGFGATDDEAGWAASVAADLTAIVRATQAALPSLERHPGVNIFDIASIFALRAPARNPPYAVIKAAMMQHTPSQSGMYAARGIRANCVAPGSFEFPSGTWERRSAEDRALYNETLATIPWGRMGTPEEVAEVVLFLASDRARWVTGQSIVVDGGHLLGS